MTLTRTHVRSRKGPTAQESRRVGFAKLVAVLGYYIGACLFFCYVEGWTIIRTIYFSTVTITTVGYGDVVPHTKLGKIVGMFFIVFGIVVVFTIISGVATSVLRRAEARALAATDDHPYRRPHNAKIAFSIFMVVFCMTFGALFFHHNGEFDGKFLDCFWWSFATVTTVGYGSLSLEHESSRIFSIFFILFSVVVVSAAIGNLVAVRDEIAADKREVRGALLPAAPAAACDACASCLMPLSRATRPRRET